jgi:metallo-beta-lactamase family protein
VGPVICTPETAALVRVQLLDRASAEERSAIEALRFAPVDVPFGTPVALGPSASVQFYRTGHILGAASARFCWSSGGHAREWSIVFSGDLGTNVPHKERHFFGRSRTSPPRSDYAVIESTYGGRVRTGRAESFFGRTELLRVALRRGVERGGTVILPVFAIDRMQTLLLDVAYVVDIDPALRDIPIIAHSRLGHAMSDVYAEYAGTVDAGGTPRWLSESMFRRFGLNAANPDDVRRVVTTIASVLRGHNRVSFGALFRPAHRWVDRHEQHAGPRIVMACGGMCNGGPVLRYLQDHLCDPASTVLFTGYAAGESVGGQLRRLECLGPAEREQIGGDLVLPLSNGDARLPLAAIRANIASLEGYSGHADQNGLMQWLAPTRRDESIAPVVFVQHGEDREREELAARIRRELPGVEVVLPTAEHRVFDLERAPAAHTGDVSLPDIVQILARLVVLEKEVRRLRAVVGR